MPVVLFCSQLAAKASADPASADSTDSQMVTIQFEGTVGDEPFACGDTYRLGSADSLVTPLDFRFYVSEVVLVNAEGDAVPLVLEQDGLWQHQNVALIDFEDKTGGCINGTSQTRAQVVGAVPPGEYTGLKFTLGVPFALNHIDSTLAPSPLNLTSMWWNWNFGYKFARIEFENVADAAASKHTATGSIATGSTATGSTDTSSADESDFSQAFALHLGSVGCQMDSAQPPVSCSVPNRPEIVLTDFDPLQNVVVTDLSALLAETNLSENQEGTAIGCMSSPEDSDCSGVMQNLGLPFGDRPTTEQTVFSVQ
ncbi:MbnP family copper-binding protein [Synechococcus sp. PCC 7335]|uniref:MbnP family copper-binding protein n=1 Tax=Synechococcus sp. (strain ATCC 29403 / PCC 7335) TaxID=91464 RepID=UPI000570C311|nr:MbnP family copper-binding protein [Synechococcus sp. PCC 7335]